MNQLRIFTQIARHGSITKAAEELHLTQPAVSIQLKNFQNQFEIPLTELVGRKIFITDFGREIVRAAEVILNEMAHIQYRSKLHRGVLAGKINISVVSTGKYVMPYFIADFLKLHPNVELSMDVTNKSRVIENLERNEVDFSLVSVIPENLSIKKLPLLKNKLYLVGKNNDLGEQKIEIEIFKSLPLIFREQGSGTRHTVEAYFNTHNIDYIKSMELTSNEAVKQAIIAGMGYSIMPLIGIKNELLLKQVEVIDVDKFKLESEWNMVWLSAKNLSPQAAALIQFVEEQKTRIAQQEFGWTNTFKPKDLNHLPDDNLPTS
ncbi:MAG: LysR family transcriptional regulator [Bacteroidia bacterium]